MNYLLDSTHKQLLDSLLASYCLCSTVQFPTRIQNNSHCAIDNIFINKFKFSNFLLYPITKRLSHHDGRSIIMRNMLEQNYNTYFYFNWKMDKFSIIDFNTKLSYESWEDIFAENNANAIFNNFFNMYLRIFYSTFPFKNVHHKSCNKAWLTPGIKILCINKRKLFLIQRNSNDPNLTNCYKRYCRILTSVIKLAKKRYYNSILTYSNNKTKATWNIIKNTSYIKPNTHNITSINANGYLSFNGQIVAETFNKYFVWVAQNIHVNNHNVNASSNHENPISYLSRAFNQLFPTYLLTSWSRVLLEKLTSKLCS